MTAAMTGGTRVPLPMTVEELDPSWFTGVLCDAGHDVEVTRVELDQVIWGTATKVRARITYSGSAPVDLRSAFCVKGGFDERLRGFAVEAGYFGEVAFYQHLAPLLEFAAPRCWWTGSDMDAGQAIVVLDDLVASGCTFGEPTEPFSPSQVADGLEILAGLHRATWNATKGDYPWLSTGATAVRATSRQLLEEAQWARHFAKDGSAVLPSELDDPVLLGRAFSALWARDDAVVHCITHGDAHIGNTYLASDGSLAFLDWQMSCFTSWARDVAYFVAGAMTVADRRDNERELLQHYRQALSAGGGPELDADEAWWEYGVHQLEGLLWAPCDESMQPLSRTKVMGERHSMAALDHDSISKLGLETGR